MVNRRTRQPGQEGTYGGRARRPAQHSWSRVIGRDLSTLIRRAHALGSTIEFVLHHTDKAIVAAGRHAERPVVLKLLTTNDPYWARRHQHEVEVYRLIHTQPPGPPTPQLICHDGDGLMVLSRLPGHPLHSARHIDTDLSAAGVAVVMATINAIPHWQPTTPPAPVLPDYRAQVDAEHAAGIIDHPARARLRALLDRSGEHREMQHGDPLPANLILDADRCGLVDFEHSAPFLPGWDLAILDTVAGPASPALRTAIEATVAERWIWDPYRVNLALAVAREIRIHRSLPATDPLRAGRLAALDIAWRRVLDLLHCEAVR